MGTKGLKGVEDMMPFFFLWLLEKLILRDCVKLKSINVGMQSLEKWSLHPTNGLIKTGQVF